MTTTMMPSTAAATGDLLHQIEAFEIDQGRPALTFEARLARENRWTGNYAGRVIFEYKRFLYLALAAGHPVTPSDQVDQAWHLHLTYSRSYWDRLCGQVLGRPLHHGPTRGGDDEDDKFNDWYEKTKASYRRVFREEPPSDIWPEASVRFGEDLHFQRVNTARNWVVPKRRVRRHARHAAMLAVFPALAGCGPLVLGTGLDVLVIVVLVVTVGTLLIGFALRGRQLASRTGNGGAEAGCGHAGHGGMFMWGTGDHSNNGSDCGNGAGDCGSSGAGSSDGGGSSGCGGGGCGGGGCGGGGD